jgi:hypothetical protein
MIEVGLHDEEHLEKLGSGRPNESLLSGKIIGL